MKKTHLPALILAGILAALTGWQIPGFLDSALNTKQAQRTRFAAFLADTYRQAPTPRKKGTGKAVDQPGVAAFHDFLMTFDPVTHTVPRERLIAACRQTDQLSSLKRSREVTWEGTSSDIGGRTRALMFDPNDPENKKVWAGGVTGGLWINNDITDASSSWIPVGDFWPVLSVRCITHDPLNSQLFYVGTGEPETALITYRESSGLGQGIWKSADGGTTWEQLPSTETFAYIADLAVRNENGTSVLYAAVQSGVYHGTHQSQPSDGLFRSDDGGDSWQQVRQQYQPAAPVLNKAATQPAAATYGVPLGRVALAG